MYIKCNLRKFQGLFERKGALKNCEVGTHSHETLRLVQVKRKRVPFHVLPNFKERGAHRKIRPVYRGFYQRFLQLNVTDGEKTQFSKRIYEQIYRDWYQMNS